MPTANRPSLSTLETINNKIMSNGLKIRLITSTEEFAACRSEWNELAGKRLFHRWEWMFHWWKNFGAGLQLALVVVTDATGQWMGIAPWYKSFSATRGRVVRQLATGSACSDYASVATRPGSEVSVATVLADLIGNPSQHKLFRDVDLFELEGHTENDPVMVALAEQLGRSGASVSIEEISATWKAELPDSWPEFENRISKSFRRKTKKATARLAMQDVAATVAATREEMKSAWPIFVDLHQRRRNSLGEPGCFADSRFERFLYQATLALAETGHAHINMTWLKNRPMVTNLEFACGRDVYMYQTGLDPEHAGFEPGHLIFTWAIKNAIERGCHSFDFLRGDEPYKARWNAVRIPLMRTRIVPNRITSRLRNGLWNAGRSVRDWTRAKPTVAIEPDSDSNSITTSSGTGAL